MQALASLVVGLLLVVAAAAAVAVAAGGESASDLPIRVASPPDEGNPDSLAVSDAEARDTDARSYAADNGVSLAVARARLIEQRSLDAALDRLGQQFPTRFAGGWIEHSPAFRAVARFKGAVPSGAAGVAGENVVLRTGAARSLAELESQTGQVFKDIADTYAATSATTFDVKTGGVEVGIESDDPDASDAQLRSRLPVSARAANVQVAFSDAPVATSQNTYGGGDLGSCTSGFTVFRVSNGEEGVLAAGHCPNDLTYYPAPDRSSFEDPFDLDWIDGHRGPYGDVQWHTTDHDDIAEFYYGTSSRRHVHGYISSFHNGDYVCHYGRVGGYDCSNVHDTSVSKTDEDGFRLERLVTVDDSITLDGDSGGPWFNGTDAAGIHHGLSRFGLGPWRSTFSQIVYVDNALPGIGLLVMPPH
jgi:hypothetical protein